MKRSKSSLRFLVLLMLFMYFLNSFKIIQPFIAYSLNYDYISQVLCVNKDKPDLQCNGKCHLNKEIQKAVEDESGKKEINIKFDLSESIPSDDFFVSFNNINKQIDFSYPVYFDKVVPVSLDKSTPPPKI